MPEQFGEKSQEATPHRRQQAREEGQVPRSQDLSSAIVLVAAIVALMYLGGSVANFVGQLLEQNLSQVPDLEATPYAILAPWNSILLGLSWTVLPILLMLMVVGIAAQVGQVGLLYLPKKVALDINHINPLKGFGRLFSMSNVMRLTFGLLKLLIVGTVAWWCVQGHLKEIMALGTLELLPMAHYLIDTTLWVCLKVAAALLILAIIDYGYQRWKHEQDLMMTTQEVREEMKNLQGDPQILARRRAVQRQLALNRMSSTVPKADVVVTNPTELAVAIQYDPEKMIAPIVVAKGAGVVAQKIRRLALEHNIPILERKELARFLYKEIDVNHPIPPEQYAAVAEVLRYVYALKGKKLPNLQQAA